MNIPTAPRKINLRSFKKQELEHDKTANVKVSLLNYRSLKNKCELVHEILEANGTDIAVLTETWLTNHDDIWIQMCDLNMDPFRFYHLNRQNRKGGGIALVTTLPSSKISTIQTRNDKHYQSCHWRIVTKGKTINILAVYRPPYSTKIGNLTSLFIDEFTEHIIDFLANNENVLVLGDFNIHYENDTDPDVQIFRDMMTALELKEQVGHPTHKCGHHLDLIFGEELTTMSTITCKVKELVSDHALIEIELNVRKDDAKKTIITTRETSKVSPEQWKAAFCTNNVIKETEFESLVTNFESELR